MTRPLSYSSLTRFELCKKSYHGHYIKPGDEAPKSLALIGGGLFHDFAEKYVAHLMKYDLQRDFEYAATVTNIGYPQADYQITQDIIPLFHKWVQKYRQAPGVTSQVELAIALDNDLKPVDWDDPDALLRVKIDRVDTNRSGAVSLHDYKTARAISTTNELQLKLYCFAYMIFKGIEGPIDVMEDYPRFGLVTANKHTYTMAGLVETPDMLRGMQKKIAEHTTWFPTACSWCSFCEIRNDCGKYRNSIRGTDLDISSESKRKELAEAVFAKAQSLGEARKLLELGIENYGPVQFADQEYGPVYTEKYTYDDVPSVVRVLRQQGCTEPAIWGAIGITKTDVIKILKKSGFKQKQAEEVARDIATNYGSVKVSQEFSFHKRVKAPIGDIGVGVEEIEEGW